MNRQWALLWKFLLLSFLCFSLIACKIKNNTPSALLEADIVDGILPLKVSFSAQKSVDTDGNIVNYKFDFGDGVENVFTSSTSSMSSTATHTYLSAGEYNAKVTVTDNKGATATSQNLLIKVVRSGAGEIEFAAPSYSGNGCPERSIATALAPNNQAISILFNNFTASAGEGTATTTIAGTTGASTSISSESKKCILSIPITIPAGFSVAVFRFDYRGFANISNGAKGTLDVKYSFSTNVLRSFNHNFSRAPSNYSNNFTFTHDVSSVKALWSECNQKLKLQIESDLNVETNSNNDFTTIILDSIDGVNAVTYYLGIKPCGASSSDTSKIMAPIYLR
ncbi:MAG: DUF4360 domain-containing protein [Oligoflexia bacterium]|nr:DUF4360 domain-containing protein [Oligoflexia bacterium]